jgi:predicted nucleic acid-binding protein
MAYLDTCVLGSLYTPETLSSAVERALEDLEDATISNLVNIEFCSLMALKVRTRELTKTAAHRALVQFHQLINDGHYEIVDVGPREYEVARAWLSSFTVPLRTADALHLACAFVHGTALWTTDKLLAQSAKALGVSYKLIAL